MGGKYKEFGKRGVKVWEVIAHASPTIKIQCRLVNAQRVCHPGRAIQTLSNLMTARAGMTNSLLLN
ncbi:MAG: hypothetical protein DI535_22975 [Citrobacter freundii]|nr:MAG: hypothetical protein DI535_22975 [Citrobacter freundii]